MTDWTIGALMGFWLALVLVATLCVLRSNRRTQDACARTLASLERVQASNSRVVTAFASWRSEALLPHGRPAPDADVVPTSWSTELLRERSGSATATTG